MAGQPREISGSLEIAPVLSVLRIEVTPPDAPVQLTLKKEGEASPRPVTERTLQVPDGDYVVFAKAPGYSDISAGVRIAHGSGGLAVLPMKKIQEVPRPAVPSLSIADVEKTGGWTKNGDGLFRDKGGLVLLPLGASAGSYEFTVTCLKGGRLAVVGNYIDSQNSSRFEFDGHTLKKIDTVNGQKQESKVPIALNLREPSTFRVSVSPDAFVITLRRGGNWDTLESFERKGGGLEKGRIGLELGWRDEYELSTFSFKPSP